MGVFYMVLNRSCFVWMFYKRDIRYRLITEVSLETFSSVSICL